MVDGRRVLVPGVTTVLSAINKPALLPWVAKVCSEHVKNNATYEYIDLDDLHGEFIERRDLEALLDAAKGVYREISQDAMDVGKVAHTWLEQCILAQISGQGEVLTTPTEERAY